MKISDSVRDSERFQDSTEDSKIPQKISLEIPRFHDDSKISLEISIFH